MTYKGRPHFGGKYFWSTKVVLCSLSKSFIRMQWLLFLPGSFACLVLFAAVVHHLVGLVEPVANYTNTLRAAFVQISFRGQSNNA